jgi:hypothetical protein
MIPLGIIGVVALLNGIETLSDWLARSAASALRAPARIRVVGVALVGLAAWKMFRVATGRLAADTTLHARLGCGLIALPHRYGCRRSSRR